MSDQDDDWTIRAVMRITPLLSVLPLRQEVGAIGPELFRVACESGLEGLVSAVDRPYRRGPSLDQGEEQDFTSSARTT